MFIVPPIDYKKLEKLYHHKGYKFFKGHANLNFFGIRKVNRSDVFDDILGLAFEYINEYGTLQKFIWCFYGTVDPGIPFLLNPMESKLGTAAIFPGQYPALWKIGFFKTKCLVQNSPVKCFRDNNRDDVFDYNPKSTSEGYYGIHFHPHFQVINPAKKIGKSSAACVVPADNVNFKFTMALVEEQAANYNGSSITFTLFDQEDIEL